MPAVRHGVLTALLMFMLLAFTAHGAQRYPVLDYMLRLDGSDAVFVSRNNVLDMIDYFEAGVRTGVKNSQTVPVVITSLSPERVIIESIDSLYAAEYTLVTSGSDTLMVVVENPSLSPGRNLNLGHVKLFDMSGGRPVVELMPEYSDWLESPGKMSSDSLETIIREVPFVAADATFDPVTNTVVFTNNMESYYVADDFPASLAAFKPRLSYELKGRKFKLKK